MKKKAKAVKAKPAGKDILSDSHPGHTSHMCHLSNSRKMKSVARLSKDAKYICYICGRAAKSKNNLCNPMDIKLDFY